MPTLEELKLRMKGVWAARQVESPADYAEAVRNSGLTIPELASLLDEIPRPRIGHAVEKCAALRDAIHRIHEERVRATTGGETRVYVHDSLELEKEPIAEGAAGRVYRARLLVPRYGLEAGTSVGVKVIKRAMLDREGEGERLAREFSIGSTIKHPHLVRICELFDPIEKRDEPSLVMELVDGSRLSQFIRDGAVSMEARIALAIQLASAVEALHSEGILHRDIKTDNILVRADARAVLVDYGVSRALDDATITSSQEFLGTVRFASPQAVTGERMVAADDIYSLGVVYYALFTGQDLFHETKNKTMLTDAIRERPPDILERSRDATGCPYHVGLLIHRMLAKSRAGRPEIAEVRMRLGTRLAEGYVEELERFHMDNYQSVMDPSSDPAQASAFEATCDECGFTTFLPYDDIREAGTDMDALARTLRRTKRVLFWTWCGSCGKRRPCDLSVA